MAKIKPIDRQKIIEDLTKAGKIVKLIKEYGGGSNPRHAAWLRDQIIRIVTGDQYNQFIEEWKAIDGNTCDYDVGTPP